MKKKRIKLLCVLAIAMAAILIPAVAFADDESGDAGMIYWAVDADNNLTISDTEIITEEGATTGSFPADRERPPQGQSWGDWGTNVVSVSIEGHPQPRSTAYWFAQNYRLVSVDLNGLDTSKCIDMSRMFYSAQNLESFTFGDDADTSKCKNMSYMFEFCGKIDFDIVASAGLDTSACESMCGMFLGCNGLTDVDLSIFNTSNCQDMSAMFKYCNGLTEIDLSAIDMSSCKYAGEMITQTQQFAMRKITVGDSYMVGDIEFPYYHYAEQKGAWKDKATGKLYCGSCLIPKGAGVYEYTTVDSAESNAYWALSGNKTDGYELIISPDELTGDYAYSGAYNTAIDPWAWETVSRCQKSDVVSVTFETGANGAKVKYPDLSFRYLIDNGEDEDYYTYGLFEGYSKLKTADLRGLDASECRTADYLFSGCSKLETLNLEGFDASSLVSVISMFNRCGSLTTIDLSNLNFQSVSANGMFEYCTSLTEVRFNPQRVTSITSAYRMFSGCTLLETVDLSNIDFSACTALESMFNRCAALTTVNWGDADMSQCSSMRWMFEKCISLTSMEMGALKAPNCEDMSYMFDGCSALETVNMSGGDTSSCTNMDCMFKDCTSLQTVNLTDLDTSSCTTLGSMFSGCTSIESLDLSGFNTPVVQYVASMFQNCTSLKTLDISSMDTTTVLTARDMFKGCTALEQLTVGPKWKNDFEKYYNRDSRAVFPVVMYRVDDTSFTEYEASAEVPNYAESEAGCNIYVNETKKNDENINADIAAAIAVTQQINALGEITSLDQKQAVEAARAAYEALTESQKAYVPASAVNVLKAAEAAIADLEATLLRNGDTVTIGYMVFTVTNAQNKTVSVKLTAAGKKKAKSAAIPATVKVRNVDCKVTTIPANGFAKAKKLKKVTGGANLVSIGAKGFFKDKKLSTFKITSASLENLGAKAFQKDKKLKKIQLANTTKLTKAGVRKSLTGSNVKTVKVMKSKVKDYKKIFTKKNCGKKVTVK